MADTEKTPARKTLPGWVLAIIAALGMLAPQLCNLIPNAVGSTVCKVGVPVVVRLVTGSDTGQALALPPPPAPPVGPPCPPERLLSNGYCMPEVSK